MTNGQHLTGTYTNGISTWDISGRINGIHNDTCGGGFAQARIELDSPITDAWGDERTTLLITLDGRHEVADSRYTLN